MIGYKTRDIAGDILIRFLVQFKLNVIAVNFVVSHAFMTHLSRFIGFPMFKDFYANGLDLKLKSLTSNHSCLCPGNEALPHLKSIK